MISRTSARDIKQTPLRVVDLFVRDRLDAILQRNDFVIASHHDKRTKLQALGKMHRADRNMTVVWFYILVENREREPGSGWAISKSTCKLVLMKVKYQTIRWLTNLALVGLLVSAIGYGNEADFVSAPKVISIPFDLDKNLIFLPVSINDSKPLSFILDTGSYSMISASQARSLGLELQLVGRTDGIGDNQQNVYLVTGKPGYGPPARF